MHYPALEGLCQAFKKWQDAYFRRAIHHDASSDTSGKKPRAGFLAVPASEKDGKDAWAFQDWTFKMEKRFSPEIPQVLFLGRQPRDQFLPLASSVHLRTVLKLSEPQLALLQNGNTNMCPTWVLETQLR